MQQGDPLGPLPFYLTIQPFITKLRYDFSIFYLDDGSVGGNVDDVRHDLHLITEEAAKVDLKLNLMKTELITDNGPSCEAYTLWHQSCKWSLFQSPLFLAPQVVVMS